MGKLDNVNRNGTMQPTVRHCSVCGQPADVVSGPISLCCEHYEQTAARMYRTADGMIYDEHTGAYRRPSDHEREKQRQVRDSIFNSDKPRRRRAAENLREVRSGLFGVSDFLPDGDER